MRGMNQQGPPVLGVLAHPPPLRVPDFARLRAAGAVVVDCRSPEAHGGGHVPRSINVGVGPTFPTWAGSVLPVDAPLILVLEHPSDLRDVCWSLLRIGYDLPKGWLADGMYAWRTSGKDVETLPQWTAAQLQQQLHQDRDLILVDVRQPQEWVDGHIANARHIT